MAVLKVLFTYILIVLIYVQNSYAQDAKIKENLHSDKSLMHDIANDLASPFTTKAYWILIGGSATTAMMYFTRKGISYRKRQSYSDAKPLGNFGVVGEYLGYGLLNLAYTSYFYWEGKTKNKEDSLRAAEHMFRATTYTLGLTMALKNTISEKRPGYPDDDQSFPSGHSSASFAFASVVAAQQGWVWGGLAHGLASFIAISRTNDDFHYLHDITAGITIGASFAWGVYYNLEKGNPYWLTLVPVKKGAGLAMGLDF
jgi:membrane-associated phospholipid phosphatase